MRHRSARVNTPGGWLPFYRNSGVAVDGKIDGEVNVYGGNCSIECFADSLQNA